MLRTVEHKEWIKSCLKRAGIDNLQITAQLIEAVFSTIQIWIAEKAEDASFRTQHDSLREIWQFVQEPDPPIGQIRARLKTLPAVSRNYLLRRARAVWPQSMLRRAPCDFSVWAQKAPSERLVSRLRKIIAEGGVIIPGRRRGNKKRGWPR